MAGGARASRGAVTPYDVLGYVVARGTLGTSEACVLVGASATDDGDVESTWSHADEHALLLPTRTAAVMLACAIGAGDAQILTTVTERRPMTKTQIKQRAAALADLLAKESGDPDAAREAWIDVGGNNAGWTRRGAKRTKSGRRVGARAR